MKIHEVEQGSDAWLALRCAIPTASEFDSLITPAKFEIRKWSTEMPKTYLATKIAEKWAGPLAGANTFAMEQGKFLEKQALPWFKLEHGPVHRVGFITSDDGRSGCSPDGLIGEDGGLEIKCPTPAVHVKYLLKGDLPDEYAHQVYGSMYVTGRPWWNFMSYCPGFPAMVVRVQRDEEKMAVLAAALAEFNARFDEAWQKIVEANGEEPEPWQRQNL